jgi:hypothetical protein
MAMATHSTETRWRFVFPPCWRACLFSTDFVENALEAAIGQWRDASSSSDRGAPYSQAALGCGTGLSCASFLKF